MSVTGRISEIKQPYGGYLRPSHFQKIKLTDGLLLNENENIGGGTIGSVVDYMTRFLIGYEKEEAFKVSMLSAQLAHFFGKKNALEKSKKLLKNIKGLDDKSIINACRLTGFDIWYRNPAVAMMGDDYTTVTPDEDTISNIKVMINRSISFFEKYGPITKIGFDFEPVVSDMEAYKKMLDTGIGTYGGYTGTVTAGDGDYLTKDTLWDLKVSKSSPTSKHTLQLLMYWIMGQHSGQECFKDITKLGLYNPRLNIVYLLDISSVSPETIKIIENDVICY